MLTIAALSPIYNKSGIFMLRLIVALKAATEQVDYEILL
jgi:hypothetical protein